MKNYTDIEASDLFSLMEKKRVLLVDVRNESEVLHGVIFSATHIQLSMLPLQYEKLMKCEMVIFYCHSGIRSAYAADFAMGKGVDNVHNLVGGVVAWNKAGYPLVPKK